MVVYESSGPCLLCHHAPRRVYIGTNASGAAALANGGDGLTVSNGASGNVIGGASAGAGNRIVYRGTAGSPTSGVHIDGSATTNNAVRGNAISGTFGVGIQLTGGAVSYAPQPQVSTKVTSGPNSTLVDGSLLGVASTTYFLDYFSNDTGADGQHYLGSVTATTDATGLALFTTVLPGGSTTSQAFTTTMTVPTFNTSAFSPTFSTTLSHVPPVVTLARPSAGSVGLPSLFTSVVADANPGTPSLTYAWSITKAGVPVVLPANVATNQPTFRFAPDQTGDYVVVLTVSDGPSAVTKSVPFSAGTLGAAVVITGLPASGILSAGASVTLTGTASGSVDTYAWSITRNGAPYALSSSATTNQRTFTFMPTTDGTYTATLTVRVGGMVSSGSAFFIVAGSAPGANPLGAPASGLVGVPITLGNAAVDYGLGGKLTYS